MARARFKQKKSKTSQVVALGVLSIVGLSSIVAATFFSKSNFDFRRKAFEGIPTAISETKFNEVIDFELDSTDNVTGYFTPSEGSYTNFIPSNKLPSSTFAFADKALTIKNGRAAIMIENTAKDELFYRIEVDLVDSGQTDLTAYISILSDLWTSANVPVVQGASFGIATAKSGNTYWWEHTQLKPTTALSESEKTFTTKTQNKFIKRNGTATDPKTVHVEIYVTPNGMYPVIDGVNVGTFPDMYLGSYTYRGAKPNFIVLSRWSTTGTQTITWKNFKIVKLYNDSALSQPDINAYFIQKAIKSNAYINYVNTIDTSNPINPLWGAAAYRAHDFYFKTYKLTEVRNLYDKFLTTLTAKVNEQINNYGTDGRRVVDVNHSLINSLSPATLLTYAVSDYLTADQLKKAQDQFIKVIDISQKYIRTDGEFPVYQEYAGTSFFEESSWLSQFYAGYIATYPTDYLRVAKTYDYLTFLAFHRNSDNQSISSRFPNTSLPFLNTGYTSRSLSGYLNFKSLYIYYNGALDEHMFHPSINYGFGNDGLIGNILDKAGFIIPPTVGYNRDLVYNTVVDGYFDPSTFRLKRDNQKYNSVNPVVANTSPQDTFILDSPESGIITQYSGMIKPSKMEDWATIIPHYSALEYRKNNDSASYASADLLARNVYYSLYSGSGIFQGGNNVTIDLQGSVKSYFVANPIYSWLFSMRAPLYGKRALTSVATAPITQAIDTSFITNSAPNPGSVPSHVGKRFQIRITSSDLNGGSTISQQYALNTNSTDGRTPMGWVAW
jgi:hypothetical protein